MENNKKSKKFKIVFSAGAFDKEVERSGMRGCKKYTKHVAEMNKYAEVLDRYDNFSSLSLLASDYAQAGGEYGIPAKKFHTGRDRLLPHQTEATHAFLKELRGFGLLADVVGSGKTYEACAVLSELSAKGKINSMLLIVPSQVYNTWKSVLEINFGLGKGVLQTLDGKFNDDYFVRNDDGFIRPKQPLIVKTEDFIKWKEHDVDNVLFDVVVVDEAHNLCGEEGSSAKALKLLSILMATKKLAKKTYCLLLSATPHSGNLADMFRLWYFIRCKGGNPEDFDEKDDVQRTDVYRKEKAYYKTYICRDANTVMEFINKVKYLEIKDNFSDEFSAFLNKNGVDDFSTLLEGEKKKKIDEFMLENETIATKVKDNIAKAYHNGVLRSIMIRQPNDKIRKGKRIENVFFFPTDKCSGDVQLKGLKGEPITLRVENLNGKKAIITSGGEYTLEEYVKENKGNESIRQSTASLFFNRGIFNALGVTDDKFKKANSIKFYWGQFSTTKRTANGGSATSDDDVANSFKPTFNNVFESKMEELKRILLKHNGDRVIVFFDYDIDKAHRCYDDVLTELYKDVRFKDRVLVGDKSDKSITENKFNAKDDTILVVTDNAFTEGANLQKSNVIVNFQVTPNPLAMEQRIGRIFRLGQENDVTVYSLADMTDLEGYVLTYFTNIGLMTSNSGDAAIIAGSNNDNMVTIRCKACGKVKLLAREDYEEYVKTNSEEVYCKDGTACRLESDKGMLMTEINSNELKCDNCGNVIKRQNTSNAEGQYLCLSINNTGSGVMCNEGDMGDRRYYCRKICSISHCDRFLNGRMKGLCEALNYYNENPQATDCDLQEICAFCKSADLCYDKCRLHLVGVNAIKGCMKCSESACYPKPHVIEFNDKWEADCPVCSANGLKGKLKPVVARTFETYVRSAYDYQQDGGKSFCENLSKESSKVSLIQEILSNDKIVK